MNPIELNSGDKLKLTNGDIVTVKNYVGSNRFEFVAIDKFGKEIAINFFAIDKILK